MVPPAAEAIDGSNCSVSVDDIKGGTPPRKPSSPPSRRCHRRRDRWPGGHVAANNRHTGFTQGIEGKNIEVLDYQNPSAWDTAEARTSPRT
jgi:hypothetical protein